MDGARLEYMEKRVREHPEDVFAAYALGMEYTSAGRLEDAARAYQGLRVANPKYLATYYQLGKVLTTLGRIAEAKDAFSEGAKVAQAAGNHKTLGELQEALAALG